MNVYRINGMSFCSDTISGLMEYIMQQDDGFIASLNRRLIVKEQHDITIVLYQVKVVVLYRIEVDAGNRVLRFVRGKRG